MNNNNGALSFEATLNNSNFDAQLRALENNTRNFTAQLAQEGQKWESTFNRLGVAVGGIFAFSRAKEFIGDVIRVRGEFQQLDIAFTTMLQSKDKADKLMEQLVDFAATTPFGLKETASAAKQLLAYGSAASTVQDELRMLGDVAAGTSQPIGDLVYLYGTLRTQGRAYSMDIRQFAGRGIPIYAELAKILGVSKDKVNDFVSAGKVGFAEVQKAFQNMTAKGSMFGGLMDAQSRSLPGQIERLKDAWDQLLNKIGTETSPVIEGSINMLSDLVENYETVGKIIAGLVATYGAYKAAVITVTTLKGLEVLTLGQSAAALGAETIAKVDNAATTANLSAAIANELAARAATANATLVQMRAEVSEAAAKKAAAIESARMAAADVAAAEAKLATAVAAQRSAALNISASAQEKAAKQVQIAQNELLIASETGVLARKQASAAISEFNAAKIGVETAARSASTLTTQANNAATAANVALVNADAIANTRLTAAQQLRVAVMQKLAAVQRLLNSLMLTNPYVLMATAVVGITAAVWAWHDSTSAQQRAQQELNALSEEAKKRKEDLKSTTSELISLIRSENTTLYSQLEAYERLQRLLPSYFGKMDLMAFKTKNAADVQKELNQAIDNQEISDKAKQYEQEKAKLEELTRKYGEYNELLSKGNYDSATKIITDEFTKQIGIVEGLQRELEEVKKRQEEAAELARIAAMTEGEKYGYYKQQKKEIESQYKALGYILGTARQIGQEFSYWEQYFNAISLHKLQQQLEDINNKMTLTVKDKSYYEKRQKDAEAAYEALPIDKLGSPEAKQAKKDYDEAGEALEKYRLKEKKAPKPKKIDIALPEGSLGEIDRQIQRANIALSKIPADQIERIKDMHATLLSLTEARVAAEKIVEFRGWEETLNYKRSLYDQYEQAQEAGYAESAKNQYAALRSEGENYIDYLKKQISPLEETLYGGGTLSERQFGQLVKLTSELNTAMGNTTTMDKFKEGLDNLKASSGSLVDYLSSLKSKMDELNAVPDSQRDSIWFAQKKDLASQIKDTNRDLDGQLKQFLQQVQGGQEKRRAIENKYRDLRKASAESEASVKAEIEKEYNKEMQALALEGNAAMQKMNETFYSNDRNGLVKFIKDATEAYEELKNTGEAAQKDIDAAYDRMIQTKRQLEDADAQNWVAIAQAIGNAGDDLKDMGGVLAGIGSFLAGAAGQANNFAQAVALAGKNSEAVKSGQKIDYVSSSAAIASGISSLVSMYASSASQRKADKNSRELDAISFQVQMNKALNDEIRLRTQLTENIYFKDYAGRVKDSIAAATDALDKYNAAFANLLENGQSLTGTKNTIDWGKVGSGALTGAGTGAIIGSFAGPIGTAIGAVVGAVVGGIVGLFSSKTKNLYGPLLKQYPQLVDANGQLNKSLAETLISTSQVDDKTKIWLQDLINAANAMEEARKQITEIISDLTSNIGSELRDVLVEAFQTGEDAAYKFSKTVEKTLENALANLIYSAIFSKAFTNLQKNLEDSLLGSGRSFADVFAEFLGQSKDLTAQFNEAMKAAQEEGKKFGFDLFNGAGKESNNSASQGISRSITEETASLISGQINAIRISQAAGLAVMRQHTTQFDVMIHYQSYLVNIDKRLAKMAETPWRALGYGENPE